jgi:hypothetical protein
MSIIYWYIVIILIFYSLFPSVRDRRPVDSRQTWTDGGDNVDNFIWCRGTLFTTVMFKGSTGWPIGVLGFDSRRGLGIFLFTTVSRTALVLTQPPIRWAPGALSLGVKGLGREADHSPPSSTAVKNAWNCTSIPQYVFMEWCLVKHRDDFTFTFTGIQLTPWSRIHLVELIIT